MLCSVSLWKYTCKSSDEQGTELFIFEGTYHFTDVKLHGFGILHTSMALSSCYFYEYLYEYTECGSWGEGTNTWIYSLHNMLLKKTHVLLSHVSVAVDELTMLFPPQIPKTNLK